MTVVIEARAGNEPGADCVEIRVAGVTTAPVFVVGRPRMLFVVPGIYTGHAIGGSDISLDGQPFLMSNMDSRAAAPETEMTLIRNWCEALEQQFTRGK